jgi:hypothetical protein
MNNPMSYIDPSGEFWFIPVIIGAVICAYSGGVIANDGQYNPAKWDWSSGKTWGYMLGGAVVGGISAGFGVSIAASGGFIANTMGIMGGSLMNSIGMNIVTGGQTPASISFGVASYDFTNYKWGYLGKKGNKWYENLGYGLGALANASDIINLPFWSGKKETINPNGTITKEPQRVGLTTNNEDWISHSAVDIDGRNAISWGPTETSYSNFEYLTNFNRGTNSYTSYYGKIDKTLSHLPVSANANIVNAYSKFLSNSKLPYNAIMSSCSTHASIGLNLAGAFNLGFLHPYLLHYNLMITPYLYSVSPYFLNLKR